MLYICRKSYLTLNVATLAFLSVGAGPCVSLETVGWPHGTSGARHGGPGLWERWPSTTALVSCRGSWAAPGKLGFFPLWFGVGGSCPASGLCTGQHCVYEISVMALPIGFVGPFLFLLPLVGLEAVGSESFFPRGHSPHSQQTLARRPSKQGGQRYRGSGVRHRCPCTAGSVGHQEGTSVSPPRRLYASVLRFPEFLLKYTTYESN